MKRLPEWNGLVLVLAVVLCLATGCSKRTRANRALEAGNRDFAAERYDEAEVEYKDAHSLDPANPTGIGQLGLLYLKEGRITDAYFFLKKAVELSPNSLPLQLGYGQICLTFHQVTNSAPVARRILGYQPTNEEALFLLMNSTTNAPELRRELNSIPAVKNNPGYHIALAALALREGQLAGAESELRLALAANPKSSEAYYVMAELRARQKDGAAATEALKKAADLAPIRSAVRVKYVDFLIRNNKIDEGRKVLNEMTTKAPDYIPGWAGLMTLSMAQKKYEESAKYADTIVSRDPQSFDGLMGRGNVQLAIGRPDNAIVQFEHVVSLFPKMPEARYSLAQAYYLAHDRTKCVENLSQTVAESPKFAPANLLLAQIDLEGGDATSAIDVLTAFMHASPNVPAQADLLLGDAYAAKGNLDGALAIYTDLAKAMPNNPKMVLLMGTTQAKQHKYGLARASFEKALQMAPGYPEATEQLVDLDIGERNYNGAAALARDQVEKFPKSAVPWELSAKVALAQSNWGVAETDLLKAIELNPTNAISYVALAGLYVHNGQDEKALQKLSDFVKLSPNPGAYLEMGVIQEHTKQYAAAAETYQKILATVPASIEALNHLAYVDSVYLHKLDQAYETAQKARELAPANPYVADTFGWVLYLKGDYSHALSALEEALTQLPDDPEVQSHVGLAYYMMDQESAARGPLQRAIASSKDFPTKDEARKCLAVLAINPNTTGPNALAELEKALEEHPEDPVVLGRIAILEEKAGQWDKAAANYESTLKQHPKLVPVMARLAWIYAYHLNNTERAMALAKEAHSLAMDNAMASAVLGHLLYQTHEYQRALDLLGSAAEQMPNQPEVLYDLAWAYYSFGRSADAETTMQKALQSGASASQIEDGKRFLTLADAYADPSKAHVAASQAQEILQKDGQYVPALMITGVLSEQSGDFQGAQKAYTQALSVFPNFAPAERQLTILDSRHFPDDSKAFAIAEKARNAYPEDSQVGTGLGILSYYQARYSRSAELLQESVRSSASDGELYYYLGMDYFQLKKSTESKQSLQKALDLRIPEKMAADAKKALENLK